MNNHDQYNLLLQSDPEPSDSDAEDIPDTLPTQTHTVTFKCVGSIHDISRQLVLSRISKILRDGGKVDVSKRVTTDFIIANIITTVLFIIHCFILFIVCSSTVVGRISNV